MHLATVSGGIPSARKLLATDSAFSAAPSARPSSRPSARHPSPQVPLWHPGVAKRSSIDASPQRPYPQVLQCHLCVARPSSVDTLVTRPRPQALQCHLPVAKQSSIGPFVHEMGPFCGRRGLDRVFLHEMALFVDVEVRSGCSDGPSPRPPYPQVLQWHPCKPRRLESQDNARDKGGGNDCVRCVGSGFDLALRDGVRIFE